MTETKLWSLRETARATGASERQLHHWIAIGFLDPLYLEGGTELEPDEPKKTTWKTRIRGRGAYRFTKAEHDFIKVIVRMTRAGISIVAIRQAHAEGRLERMLFEVERAAGAGRELLRKA